MGSPLGDVIQPTATAGAGNQQSFVNALTSATIGPDGQFKGVPGYTGQLTPDFGSTMLGQLSSQNSYNPNAGMTQNMGGAANVTGGVQSMLRSGSQGFGGFNANNANMSSPWMTNGANQYSGGAMSPNGYNMNNGQSAGALLAGNAMGYGAGAAVDSTPAWNAMVGAQQQNLQTGADQLAEQFNNGGGLFSSAYGNAQGQYQSNARAQQNAQLTQGQLQSQLGAQQVQANAANQLSGNQLQLGQQQYNALQNTDTANYQNWFAQQAQNNPLLSMMYSQANAYAPSPFQTQGWLAPVMAGVKQAAAGAAGA